MGNYRAWNLQFKGSNDGQMIALHDSSCFEIDFLLSVCSPYRLEKSKKFKKSEDQYRCLAVGWCLQKIVMNLLGKSLSQESSYSTGQPYLPEFPGWNVSISHSGEWVVCAMALFPLGVDVERIDLENFTGNDASSQCRDWTHFEAYAKFLGKGLSLQASELKMARLSENQFTINSLDRAGYDFALDSNHWLSIFGPESIQGEAHFASPIL